MNSNYKISESEMRHIRAMTYKIVTALNPLAVYLFGSFARGDYNADSDYDFCIVVANDAGENIALSVKARLSIIDIQNRPVDIIVRNRDYFARMQQVKNTVDYEVKKYGVRLYGDC